MNDLITEGNIVHIQTTSDVIRGELIVISDLGLSIISENYSPDRVYFIPWTSIVYVRNP